MKSTAAFALVFVGILVLVVVARRRTGCFGGFWDCVTGGTTSSGTSANAGASSVASGSPTLTQPAVPSANPTLPCLNTNLQIGSYIIKCPG